MIKMNFYFFAIKMVYMLKRVEGLLSTMYLILNTVVVLWLED